MRLDNLLTWLHVSGNLVWVGSMMAVGLLLVGKEGEPAVRGKLGLRIYEMVANPGFVVSLFAGMTRLMLDHEHYLFETRWMHGKLAFALVAIIVHHVIGAYAKKQAEGETALAGTIKKLIFAFLASTSAAVFFVLVVRATGL